ncbi:hypothetical protein [Candidatus Poriferisodalis sp.]|uniref:hypothetical protein n=1 Tax=Candidatus Poriferisodalis sp. TaxID=3101277 RepID=UPI003B0162F7
MSSAEMRAAATPVVYRAMWNDDRPGLHELAARTFRAWARALHPQLGGGDAGANAKAPVPSEPAGTRPSNGFEGEVATDEARVNLRRETAAHGGVSETLLELDQQDPSGSSVVVLRVLTNGTDGWVWVDVEMPHEQAAVANISDVQVLVCTLLDDAEQGGGRPRMATERLGTRPLAVEPTRQAVVPLANALRGASRVMPCVVMAHDYLDGPGPTMERARTTARQLAGLARVYVLPAQTINPFQVAMGPELDVQPGEARLYLPGEHEPHRHRTLAAEFVRSDLDETARWFGRLLQTMLVDREPPELYRRSRQLLGDRRERHEPSPDTDAAERAEALEAEVEAVWDALYQAREERAAARAERDEQSEQLYDVLEELEMAQQRVEQLHQLLEESRDQTVRALMASGTSAAADADPTHTKYPQVTSIRQALSLARINLRKVEIPPEAEHRIADLDSAIESRSWARSVFDGLLALEVYAHKGSDFGDFRDWCARSKHERAWFANAKKLAMNESEEVMRRSELRQHRVLPVSKGVDPSGRTVMQSHLKLANGSMAPRLYFHDDTRGPTGKVHVGYIGPHMPTKRFRS